MSIEAALLLREIARRRNNRLRAIAESLREDLFDLQKQVWDCKDKQIRLGVGRRGGKTKFLTRRALYVALTFRMPLRYSGERGVIPVHFPSLTMQGAKDFWVNLLQLADLKGMRRGIDYHAQQQEKTFTVLASGNQIQLRSLANIAEADKARGGKFPEAFVDEAQSVPDDVFEYLIQESLGPALRDLDGRFTISGTEARVHAGFWHESRKPEKGYRQFDWWMGDNPFLDGDSDEWIKEFCRQNGWPVESSFIQREFYNRPVVDINALVYPYREELNGWEGPLPQPIHRVGAIDLGFRCDTARILCDYSYVPDKGYVYILHDADVLSEASPSAIGAWVAPWLRARRADMNVIDSNGGGKLAAEELIQAQGLPLAPADARRDKRGWQSEMAAHLMAGSMLVCKESARKWVGQAGKLERDPGTGKEMDGPPRDVLDAGLYAFHHCQMLAREPEGSDDLMLDDEDEEPETLGFI